MINVAVIDDQPIILNGFKQMFNEAKKNYNVDLIFTSTSPKELFTFLESNNFQTIDIVIIDFKMPDINGIELTKKLKEAYPNIKCILFSSYYNTELIENAMSIGARSCLKKEIRYKELFEALIEVHRSGYYLPDDFPLDVIQRITSKKSITPIHDFSAKITSREKEIAILIAQDKSYKEIGDLINISPRTVEEHKNNFSKKRDARKQLQSQFIVIGWGG